MAQEDSELKSASRPKKWNVATAGLAGFGQKYFRSTKEFFIGGVGIGDNASAKQQPYPPPTAMKLHRNCEGNHPDLGATVSRREFVSVGAIAGLGLTLPNLLRLQAAQVMPDVASFKPIADSIIHIYLPGGMAHQESWYPKPFAAPDYRGP